MVETDNPRHHRKIRLPAGIYRRPGTTWLVTITAHDRAARPFASEPFASEVASVLVSAHGLRSCRLLAYCLMPDHLHFVTTVGDGGDLVKLVDGFKSYSTKVRRDAGGVGPLWQVSFHDRGLRTPEDVEVALRYVWDNPARVGLIAADEPYAHRGGELFDAP